VLCRTRLSKAQVGSIQETTHRIARIFGIENARWQNIPDDRIMDKGTDKSLKPWKVKKSSLSQKGHSEGIADRLFHIIGKDLSVLGKVLQDVSTLTGSRQE
jgi:hypothetical protein